MGKTIDAEEFLSWLNEAEEELKGERADELNPDRKDEGILLTTETVRKYVESMCKIDDADSERGWIPVTERLPEYERDYSHLRQRADPDTELTASDATSKYLTRTQKSTGLTDSMDI